MSHATLPRMRELPRSYIGCLKQTEVTFRLAIVYKDVKRHIVNIDRTRNNMNLSN
jgi:hypothetical protein